MKNFKIDPLRFYFLYFVKFFYSYYILIIVPLINLSLIK